MYTFRMLTASKVTFLMSKKKKNACKHYALEKDFTIPAHCPKITLLETLSS